MKKMICLLAMLCLCAYACADGLYSLPALLALRPGEQAVLCCESSWYSSAPVYRGTTDQELSGCCVLHSVSVLLNNARSKQITAQEVAQANNQGLKARDWSANVSWKRVEKAFLARFDDESLADYADALRRKGISREERRYLRMERIAALLDEYGQGVGVIVHFNSSGSVNGGGHRHAVVVLGYIKKDGRVTDLLVSDSATPAPLGACVRLSESIVPHSMLGDKALASLSPEEALLTAMDDAVSCRYLAGENKPDARPVLLWYQGDETNPD